jgi:hypothetical protein
VPDTTTAAVTLTQIGTVEITRIRVYPLPGGELSDKDTAQVEPGHYPLMRQADGSVFWVMTARRNNHEVESESLAHISPGMFSLSHNDRASGEPFLMISKVIDAEEFAVYVDEAAADPSPSVRFTLTDA